MKVRFNPQTGDGELENVWNTPDYEKLLIIALKAVEVTYMKNFKSVCHRCRCQSN